MSVETVVRREGESASGHDGVDDPQASRRKREEEMGSWGAWANFHILPTTSVQKLEISGPHILDRQSVLIPAVGNVRFINVLSAASREQTTAASRNQTTRQQKLG